MAIDERIEALTTNVALAMKLKEVQALRALAPIAEIRERRSTALEGDEQ